MLYVYTVYILYYQNKVSYQENHLDEKYITVLFFFFKVDPCSLNPCCSGVNCTLKVEVKECVSGSVG